MIPSWREDKIALLATATITVSGSDPEPDLPDCFRDQKFVEKLLRGIWVEKRTLVGLAPTRTTTSSNIWGQPTGV